MSKNTRRLRNVTFTLLFRFNLPIQTFGPTGQCSITIDYVTFPEQPIIFLMFPPSGNWALDIQSDSHNKSFQYLLQDPLVREIWWQKSLYKSIWYRSSKVHSVEALCASPLPHVVLLLALRPNQIPSLHCRGPSWYECAVANLSHCPDLSQRRR